MMRLRRANLLLALSLFISAATVHAECASSALDLK
jgi:hypothetical protein